MVVHHRNIIPTYLGPHGDEVTNLSALAVRHGITARDIKSTIFAYPTAASVVANMF